MAITRNIGKRLKQYVPDGAHRALNDCRMNQQIYEQMGKLIGNHLARKQEEPVVRCAEVNSSGERGVTANFMVAAAFRDVDLPETCKMNECCRQIW